MSKNTIVRGMLVPSLKNKPLDGRQLVPTLGDIVNIENPFVGFIFYVESEGRWYEVVSLTDRIIDELTIPNDMVDEYKEFGKGMTDAEKEEYITKALVEQRYLTKEEAQELYQAKGDYITKQEVVDGYQPKGDYITTEAATEAFQPKGEYVTTEEANEAYQPKGDYATTQKVEELEQLITGGGSGEEGTGGTFVDAPRDGKTYGRKDGLWDELVDAPSDGLAYARINGQWAAIESGNALDPMLPVLSLSIGSSIENDATIAKVMAKVTYADKEFTLGDGGKMNVPYGLSVTVTFPNVENYSTPEVVVFDDVQGSIEASGTYINLQEVVNVYVSADDGSAVDGQIVTAEISSSNVHFENGLYIEDINGHLYKKEEWDESYTLNSIILISEKLKVRTYPKTGIDDFAVNSSNAKELEDALNDYDGESNTSGTGGRLPFSTAKNYTWANGDVGGYIPALGELMEVYQYWDEYAEIMDMLSINISVTFIGSSSGSIEDSVSVSSYKKVWVIKAKTGEISAEDVGNYLIAKKITDEDFIGIFKKESKEVLGGQASFNVSIGDNVKFKIDAKGDEYRTPDEVHLTVQDGENNVSLVYNLLVIDTIYINNLIADTSSIISGEMNGKAVQAIWNNVHRYLGKIVTKEDGTEELVLLDIDQNDNRYYTDGSMIDLEALGTTAYFFTKIPAMSYKITQMSDNIYKVQISYKHKPEGDGWKHFDELIVPTFAASNGTNNGVPAYFEQCNNRYNISSTNLYIDSVNLFDLSNMFLLLLAKYGIDPEYSQLDALDLGIFTDSNKYVINGYSLSQGVKDSKFIYPSADSYNSNADVPIYSLLGVENLIDGVYSANYYSASRYSSAVLPIKMRNGSSLVECMTFIPSSDTLKITMLDGSVKTYNTTVFEGAGYYKSLLIDDNFFFIPKTLGATSETYYKSKFEQYNISQTTYGYFILGFYMGLYMNHSTYSYVARPKVVCPHRIESDRDAFEALTNIWVG